MLFLSAPSSIMIIKKQGENESTEQFITSLYQLAESCEYGELKEEMIQDRIIVGIKDQGLSKCLQLDPTLTLEKAKTMTRQREIIVITCALPRMQHIMFVRRKAILNCNVIPQSHCWHCHFNE